jgi:nucleotide-binding universal stress UspA family protein
MIARYDGLAQTPVDRPRKFVAVVDDTPECRLAVRFAAGRAAHSLGGKIMLLHVIRPAEFVQWGGVNQMMETEARELADSLLAELSADIQAHSGLIPECRIEHGKTTDVVLAVLKNDPEVFGLVLGASAQGDPGPLVDFFTHKAASQLPCPLVIVPGGMSEAAVDALV